jgi:hypothetical protein
VVRAARYGGVLCRSQTGPEARFLSATPVNTAPGHRPGRLRWSARTPQLPAARQHAIDDQQAPGYGLFPGGPGRTTTPEHFNGLMNGLEKKVFGRFPDAARIYSGHGMDSTLGAERPHLAEWRERGW